MGIERESNKKFVFRNGYRERATKNLCSEMGRERERARIYVQKGRKLII